MEGEGTRLDRLVAVKVLPDHLASKPEALGRFEAIGSAPRNISAPIPISSARR